MNVRGYFVAWSIATILTIIAPATANERGISRKWFSIVSVLQHDEALDRAHDVQLSNDLAFVPGKGGSLAVIDVTDPKKPGILWFRRDVEELADAEAVLLLENHLLLGARDFFSIDISNPCKPAFLGKVADRAGGRIDRINGMVKRGDYVFAANKSGWIDVFDVSNLALPRLRGALEVRTKFGINDPHDIDAFGDYIIIVAPNGFGRNPVGHIAVFRVTDQSGRPIPVAQWLPEGMLECRELIGANRVQVSGSFAYVGGSWTPSALGRQAPGTRSHLAVIDLSVPKNPRVVASVPFSDVRGPNGLTIAGKVAFIAGGQSVDAIGISDPYRPVKLGGRRFPRIRDNKRTDNAHDLVYRAGYLYVSCQTDNALMILKVENKHIRALAAD